MSALSPAAPPRLRVVRIIDRLNVGGPAQHVAWLTAGADPAAFTTTLLTGAIAPGEGDMGDVVRALGVEPVAVPGLGRAVTPGDALVVLRLVRALQRLRPAVVHTHKAKAGAVGRVAVLLYRARARAAVRRFQRRSERLRHQSRDRRGRRSTTMDPGSLSCGRSGPASRSRGRTGHRPPVAPMRPDRSEPREISRGER